MASSIYVADEAWGNRWECVRELKSGAQGNAMLARHLHEGSTAFLKELKGQTNSERRARFCREAEVLAVLDHSGIPTLLETNAQRHLDKSYHLFIATEFIDGIDLPTLVSSAEFTTEQALVIADQLCRILNHAHERDVTHRDIKPDNILVSGISTDMQVHLVDFGVAYLEDTPEGFATEVGQEIGNRFLRLPEFSSGADNKNDPRSDVTLAAGILFYMLTGIKPSILQDDLGDLPHQRDKPRVRLLQHGLNKDRLLALFDKAFQVEITHRFQSIEELRQAISALTANASGSSASVSTISQLKERLSVSSNRLHAQRHEAIQQALTTVRAIVVGLSTQLDGFVSPSQTNMRDDPQNERASTELGLFVKIDPSKGFMATVSAKAVGSELRLGIAPENIATPLVIRFPLDAALSDEQRTLIRERFISELDLVTNVESTEVSDSDLAEFVKRATETANRMAESMTQSVVAYAHLKGAEMLDNIETPHIMAGKRINRVIMAQAMVRAMLRSASRYVRFNCFAKVRIPKRRGEELFGIQEVSVTVMAGKTGDGPTAVARPSGFSGAPFSPTEEQLADILKQAIKGWDTYDPSAARLRRELLS